VSGASYREYIDRAPLAMLLVDGRGRIRDHNPAALLLLGYEHDELLTLGVTDLVPPHAQDASVAGFAELKSTGLRHADLVLRRKDGVERLVELNASRIDDDLYMGFLDDVTVKRKAEAVTRLSEARFRAILESSRDGFTLADGSGTFLEVSTAFAHMLGYEAHELVGRNVSLVNPDADEEEMQHRFRDNQERGTIDLQIQLLCKDGSRRPVELRSTYLDRDGGLFVGFFRDIRHRLRSETLLRIRLKLSVMVEQVELDELMQAALDEAEVNTGSSIGFYHFVDEDQDSLTLTAWSTNTLKHMCTAEGKHSHYAISKAGVWVDAFHTHRPVIHNDYPNLPHRKGMPEGHATVSRELVVPVMRKNKVTAILGIGNKATDYDDDDATFLEELASIIYDLVERKRAEIALAESERKHRMMVETSSEGIWSIDADGVSTFVNPAICSMLGYAPQEMLGRSMLDFMDVGERPDQAAQLQTRRLGETGRYVRTLLRKDGSPCVCQVSASPLMSDGRFMGSFGLFTDISAQRRAEEALQASVRFGRSVLNSLSSHVAVMDRDGVIVEVNEAWTRFAKENGATDMTGVGVGTSYFDVCGQAPEDELARNAMDGIRRVMDGALSDFQMEYPCHCQSEDRWFQLRVLPLKDSQGGVVVAHENITARRHFEQQLKSERERMDMIIRAANVGTWEWKVQTGETLFNERWASILGYTLDELEPLSIETWTRFAHPEDLKHSGDLLARHFRGELPDYECVARMQHRDGSWVWVLDRGRVTAWADDGRPLLMQGTHTDITDYKQLEEVQAFLARANSGKGESTFFNSLALFLSQTLSVDQVSILRLERGSGMVRDVAVWRDGAYLEQGKRPLGSSVSAKVVEDGELVIAVQAARLHPEDEALAELQAEGYVGQVLHGHDGRPMGVVSVCNRRELNRTAILLSVLKLVAVRAAAEMERLAAEQAIQERNERYELVIAGSQSAIWDWDLVNHIMLYSPQWKALHGYGLDEEIGNSEDLWCSTIHPDDNARVMAALEAHMEGRSAVFSQEYRILRRDGDWRWIADRGVAMRNGHGRVIRMAGSEVDITERKLAEEAMQEHARILQSRNEELARFNRVAVGRELRMIELKQEVNDLCRAAGRSTPYHVMAVDELTRQGAAPDRPTNAGS